MTLADGSQLEIVAQGNVHVPSLGTIISNALCVPRIYYCLLSVPCLVKSEYKVVFENDTTLVSKGNMQLP